MGVTWWAHFENQVHWVETQILWSIKRLGTAASKKISCLLGQKYSSLFISLKIQLETMIPIASSLNKIHFIHWMTFMYIYIYIYIYIYEGHLKNKASTTFLYKLPRERERESARLSLKFWYILVTWCKIQQLRLWG